MGHVKKVLAQKSGEWRVEALTLQSVRDRDVTSVREVHKFKGTGWVTQPLSNSHFRSRHRLLQRIVSLFSIVECSKGLGYGVRRAEETSESLGQRVRTRSFLVPLKTENKLFILN